MDPYSAGSEIAMRLLHVDYGLALDDILCHPSYAEEFDRIAARFAPGHCSFDYRWAALAIRKRSRKSRVLAEEHFADWHRKRLPRRQPLAAYASDEFARPGVYVVSDAEQSLYVGETVNLQERVTQMLGSESWMNLGCRLLAFIPRTDHGKQHGLQSMLVHRLNPLLNSELLRPKLDGAAANDRPG